MIWQLAIPSAALIVSSIIVTRGLYGISRSLDKPRTFKGGAK